MFKLCYAPPITFLHQREASNSWKLYVTAPHLNALHRYLAVWSKQVCCNVQSNSWADTVYPPQPCRVMYGSDCNTNGHTQTLSQPPNCPDPSSVVLSWLVTGCWTAQRHHAGSKASIASFLVPGSADTLRCPDRSELFRWHKEIKWSSQRVGGFSDWCLFQTRNGSLFF